MRGGTDVSPSSSTLIALKPRQVLLLEQQRRGKAVSTLMAKNKPEEATQLKPEDELILTFSVALWLENKGYPKVLKRFLSAAQIQDDWKDKALNLTEIFSKYLEICSSAHEDLKSMTKQEEHVVGRTENNGDANGTSEEMQSKKKKKKSKEDVAVNGKGRKLEVTCEKINKTYADANEEESLKAPGLSHKDQNTKASEEPNGDKVPEITEDQSSKKQKEKKKKKSKLTDADEKKIDVIPKVTELKEDGPEESKKASKKRKRMPSDENENQSGHEVAIEESKSKKSKGLEEGKGEIFEAGQVDLEKFSAKQNDESSKNFINNNGKDKSSQKKSANRQPNSSEPKTVKAFQRVKADEVEFVDERLQDNSYWAKDGADTGYGAKAQEVLGRVKGRDFRHEKTKKKRGSYRGGQIDQQSHSIKFNYSDEE